MVEEKRPKKKMDPILWAKKYLKKNPWDNRIYTPTNADGEGIEKKDKFCSVCEKKVCGGYFTDDWYCNDCSKYRRNNLTKSDKEKIRNEIKNK